MNIFDFTAVSCTARQAKSVIFSGCPSANIPFAPSWPVSVADVAYPSRRAAGIWVKPWMLPAHPPLPIIWNLPFQFSAGSQSSILISESAEGFRVAATRQCAGNISGAACAPRPVGAAAGAPPRPWGACGPAGTNSTVVKTASAGWRDFNFSQVEESRAAADATPPRANRNVSIFISDTPVVYSTSKSWIAVPYHYLPKWARSFSLSVQTDSKISPSARRLWGTLIVNGLVYILGSSKVI